MEATQFCQKLLEFDGSGNAYQWFINIEQFWNAQKFEEQKKFLEIQNFLRGKPLAWFRLWKLYNPNADKSVFDIAFMHRYVPDSRPILPPEISWNEVSDLDVVLEEIRARLENFESRQKLRQKRFKEEEESLDLKFQEKAAEIQGKKEVKEDAESECNFQSQQQEENSTFNFQSQQQEKLTANPRSTTPFQQQSQQQQQNSKKEKQDEVTEPIDGGERKESEIVSDGSGWVHSNAEVTVSVEGRGDTTDIAPTVVEWATRPTPELPDPNSLAVVRTEATSCKEEGRTEAVTGGHSGAADGFVAEGKRRTLVTLVDGDATVTDRGLRARMLRQSVLLSPPPLMAAVFPWDRGGGCASNGLYRRSTDSSEDKANAAENSKERHNSGSSWRIMFGAIHVSQEKTLEQLLSALEWLQW
ncbi:hypothetical protein PIB30_031689 [Stylosanthes scabra]|uniref:Uncharacterized protein n=1 Tax=Stylosanthes scabra TaxID=79078 RepID=A0ABU6QCC2_9FABA|nr:hypothetical protein [Stylosanthes scabra]